MTGTDTDPLDTDPVGTDPVDTDPVDTDPLDAVWIEAGLIEVATVDLGTLRAPAPRPRRGSGVRGTVRVAGELLITFGLIVLLFAVYEVYGKTAIVDSHQAQLEQTLTTQWATPPPAPTPTGPGTPADPGLPPGGALARLYIPGLHLHWVVVEGVDLPDLAYGPGHYPGTALPGQIGNFSVAGHRIPAIFWNLQAVRPGDPIVVETRTKWYLYQVTVNEIVTPTSVQVIAPTPDHIGVPPTEAMLTLTTCNPKWANFQRMVVHAQLVGTRSHAAGPPVDLGS